MLIEVFGLDRLERSRSDLQGDLHQDAPSIHDAIQKSRRQVQTGGRGGHRGGDSPIAGKGGLVPASVLGTVLGGSMLTSGPKDVGRKRYESGLGVEPGDQIIGRGVWILGIQETNSNPAFSIDFLDPQTRQTDGNCA